MSISPPTLSLISRNKPECGVLDEQRKLSLSTTSLKVSENS
jgi:hypothetical protein